MHIDVGVAVARDQGIRWGHERGKWTLRERNEERKTYCLKWKGNF